MHEGLERFPIFRNPSQRVDSKGGPYAQFPGMKTLKHVSQALELGGEVRGCLSFGEPGLFPFHCCIFAQTISSAGVLSCPHPISARRNLAHHLLKGVFLDPLVPK